MGKRLIPQRRARGGSHYRSPSHRHVDDIRIPHYEAQGTIKDLIQAPGRTCPLAVIDFEGKKSYQLAVEGTRVGQKIELGGTEVRVGNILALANIPEGTLVNNIEGQPGDGGKFVKTAGASALVVSRGKVVVLNMPSGELKEFNPACRAAIGVVAGGGRIDKPLGKAGK
ncbi:MAG: 50S ribosomal protein L2, partial [Methanomethylophilus sp.]|nr:50S ribosomal protein L2 [Methanomethylophilus sp.]